MPPEVLHPKPGFAVQTFEMEGAVMIVYPRPMLWVKFSAQQARDQAAALIKVANQIDGIRT